MKIYENGYRFVLFKSFFYVLECRTIWYENEQIAWKGKDVIKNRMDFYPKSWVRDKRLTFDLSTCAFTIARKKLSSKNFK